MANELRTSVVMDLRGNLERQARRYEGAMRGLATSGQRHMGRLSRATAGAGRMLDRVGNRWTALATGAGAFGTVRNLVALEERFTRLGIQAGKSEEQMDALREKIFETARQPEIRVDPAQITSAIEAIVEKTGDLEFAEQNIRNIGAVISATGAQGTNIGQIMAEFQKMDIRAPQEVLRTIDTLNEQGKAGAFTLKDLAALGPRVVNAYTAMGRTGPQAIREMGATLQVVMRGVGEANNTATAFEALLRTLQDAKKIEMLQGAGIQVFDPEALKEGEQILRPINELMVDIVDRVDGRASMLSKVFDAEAMRSFNSIISEYNSNGGNITTLERFMGVQADGTATLEDSARAADTAGGALRNLSSAWQSFADSNLSEHIQAAADALNSLDQETVDRWLKIAGMAAGGIGGLYALRSLGRLGVDLGRGAKGIWGAGRSTTGGIAGNGGLGGVARQAAPLPVYVTNWGSMPGGRSAGRTTRKGGGYTPPTTQSTPRTSGTTAPANTKPRLSTRALNGATTVGSRGLAGGSVALTAYSLGQLLEDAVESTDTGNRMGNYAELARQTAKEVVMEYARNSAETFREASESVVKIFVDQDGRVRDATAERGDNGPDIDLDVGNWGVWP